MPPRDLYVVVCNMFLSNICLFFLFVFFFKILSTTLSQYMLWSLYIELHIPEARSSGKTLSKFENTIIMNASNVVRTNVHVLNPIELTWSFFT